MHTRGALLDEIGQCVCLWVTGEGGALLLARTDRPNQITELLAPGHRIWPQEGVVELTRH